MIKADSRQSARTAGTMTLSSKKFAVGLLCVALCTSVGEVMAAAPADSAAAADSLGPRSPETEAMVDWMHKNGGQVNVAVVTLPSLGRKVYAPRAFKKDDVLCEIPLSCAFTAYANEGDELWSSSGAKLLEEMSNPASHYQPYFKTLPPRERVWSFYDLPESYLPLIQSKALETNIASLQGGKLQGTGSSSTDSEELRYSLSLLETRAFGAHDGDGLQMLPVLDMADHTNECINYYNVGVCSSSSSSGSDDNESENDCIIWYAGQDIKKGEEVCNNYRYLAQDSSLLQYGFLQGGPTAQLLSRIDRHDFNPDDPWVEPAYNEHGVERFEPVSPEQVRAEMTRLQQLLADLRAKDAELKDTVQPHPRDNGGWYLEQLWTWRGQRQVAIEIELARLSKVLKRLEAAVEVYDKPKPQVVYDNLLSWLKEGGAQVNVAVKAAQADQPALSAPLQAVYASKGLQTGDYLAVIPVNTTYSIKDANSVMAAALTIIQHLHQLQTQPDGNNDSAKSKGSSGTTEVKFWSPYYTTLPSLGSFKTSYNIPEDYATIIQQAEVESLIAVIRAEIDNAWGAARAAVDAATDHGLIRADLSHMAAVVSSRIFSAGSDGLRLIPLIDLPRYDNSCPHTIQAHDCPFSKSSRCIVWKAGKPLAAGDEVCTAHHGHLLPDIALLQYGLVLEQDQSDGAAGICGIDDPRYEVQELFAHPGAVHERMPPFTGTYDDVLAEAASLTILLQQITSEDAEADIAAVTAAAEDWDGRLLQQLLQWRQQRIAALQKEVKRLMEQNGLHQDDIAAEVGRQITRAAQLDSNELTDSDKLTESETLEYESDYSETTEYELDHSEL